MLALRLSIKEVGWLDPFFLLLNAFCIWMPGNMIPWLNVAAFVVIGMVWTWKVQRLYRFHIGNMLVLLKLAEEDFSKKQE